MAKKEGEQNQGESKTGFLEGYSSIVEHKKLREKQIPFKEYLERISKKEVTRPKNAYDLIHEAVITPAPRKLQSGAVEYPFFSEKKDGTKREDENAVYGLYGAIETIANFILTGKETGGKKKALLLVGQSGVGKSIIVESIKNGLVEYARTIQNPIFCVDGCPIQEEPLNLLEPFCDNQKKEELKKTHEIEITEPCPDCQGKLREKEYDIEKFNVVPINFSSALGLGITKITSELTKEHDPEKVKLVDQLILKSNRGILEISEFFQHPDDFLTTLNDLIRGRKKQYEGKQYHLDNFIIAHTTSEEWEDKKDNKNLKSLLARMEVVKIPFNLSSSAESEIYIKSLKEGNIGFYMEHSKKNEKNNAHLSRRVFDAFGEFAVLTRFNSTPVTNGLPYDKKLKLYRGEKVNGFSQTDMKEIERNEAERGEGYKGLSPAVVEGVILGIVAQKNNEKCLNPVSAVSKLREYLLVMGDKEKRELGISTKPDNEKEDRRREVEEKYKTYTNFLGIIESNNGEWLAKTIKKSFRPDYEEAREGLLNDYIDNALALRENIVKRNPITKKFEGANIELLEEIENDGYESTDSQDTLEHKRHGMRAKAVIERASKKRKSEIYAFNDAPEWLRRGIDAKLFGTTKDMDEVLSLITLPNFNARNTVIDPKKVKKFGEVKQALVEKYGFCEHCVPELMKYAKEKELLEKYKDK